MDDNNIEEKIKNLEEWNAERSILKPVIEIAVEYHNKARREAYWKNYEKASEFYKEAIKNYKTAISLNPKYYLQDVLERIDCVIEEHVSNAFNLKISGGRLKTENGIKEFVVFVENLTPEEKRYINLYDIALSYLQVGDMYYDDGDLNNAYNFYEASIAIQCGRPFINKEACFKIGRILFSRRRFKEALLNFISVLSFDRNDPEAIGYIDKCLKELKIYEHKNKFLSATPNEAKKLIMEVL